MSSNQKASLQEAMAAISDAELHLTKSDYGQNLIAFIDLLGDEVPDDNQAKLRFLKERLQANNNLKEAFEAFKKALLEAFKTEKPELSELWELLKTTQGSTKTRVPKKIFVKRGIAKLMILPAEERQKIYAHIHKGADIQQLPNYAYTLGFAQKRISGANLTDDEIESVVKYLEPEVIECIIDKSPVNTMMRWIDPLRNLGNVELFLAYVKTHYDELITPEGMLKHLEALHKNPYSGLDRNLITGDLHTVWLFYFIFDLAKVHFKKRQGFGLAEMAKRAQPYLLNTYPANNRVWTIVTSDYINLIGAEIMPADVLYAQAKVLVNIGIVA